MSNQSIVEHRANYYYVEFREDLLIIALNCAYKKPGTAKTKCKASPYCKSLILAILEGWTNDKRGRGSDLSVYMTYPQWIDAMYGMFGRSVIIDSLDELIGEGLVSRQPHRMYDRDTYKYLLNHRELNKRLRDLPDRDFNEKHPQVNWQSPKIDPSTNRPHPSTSRRDTHLQVDGNPSTSRRNIEPTKKHNITSNKERTASVSKSDTNTSSLSSKSPDVILMDTWDDICGELIPRDKKHKEAAVELARCGATREDLINNRDFCLRTNPQWYEKNGVDLAAIARNWGKWKSSLSQGKGKPSTPVTSVQDGMTEQQAKTLASQMLEAAKMHSLDFQAYADKSKKTDAWLVRLTWSDGGKELVKSPQQWQELLMDELSTPRKEVM